MPTRNVVLTAHHEALIERLVASGRYQNASEVLRAGLRELERQDGEYEAKLTALRAAVQVGLDDIEAGRYTEFSSVGAFITHLEGVADSVLKRRRR
ncbi:MAG: type II toxin-antitoxin system ParD family antitoxin [Acetobacteraceae bacterium]|nr:type II toxin-antitoxin system ParD family antitoxin [Acetobacteraceae bacterium]